MLIVLDIRKAPKRSFFGRIKYFFCYPEIQKEYIGERGFQHIRIVTEESRRGVNWAKIIKEIDKEDIIVARRDLELPPELKKHLVSGIYYKNLLKIRAVLDVLTYANIPPSQITAAVWDNDGELVNTVKELLKHTSTLKVITNKPDVYNNLASEVMEEFGASILITENEAAINTADVVVSMYPLKPTTFIPLFIDLSTAINKDSTVNINEKNADMGIKNVKISLPYRFKYCIVDGLDETDFCAGLFQTGMKRAVNKLDVDRFCYYNKMVDIREGAEQFRTFIEKKKAI